MIERNAKLKRNGAHALFSSIAVAPIVSNIWSKGNLCREKTKGLVISMIPTETHTCICIYMYYSMCAYVALSLLSFTEIQSTSI